MADSKSGEGCQQPDASPATLLVNVGYEELFIEAMQHIAGSMKDETYNVFSVPRSIDKDGSGDIAISLDDVDSGRQNDDEASGTVGSDSSLSTKER